MYPSCAPENMDYNCNMPCSSHHPRVPDFTKDKFPIHRNDISGGLCPSKKSKKKGHGKSKGKCNTSNPLLNTQTAQDGTKGSPSNCNIRLTITPKCAFGDDKPGHVPGVNGEKVEETCEEFMNIVQDAVLETVEKSVKCIMDEYSSRITRKLDTVCLVVQEMKTHIWKMNAKNDVRFKCLCEFLFEHLETGNKGKKELGNKCENEKKKYRLGKRQSNEGAGEQNICCCQHLNGEQKTNRSARNESKGCGEEESHSCNKTKKRSRSKGSNVSSSSNLQKSDNEDGRSCSCKRSASVNSKKKKTNKSSNMSLCPHMQKSDNEDARSCSCKKSANGQKKETKKTNKLSNISLSSMHKKSGNDETKGCSCSSSPCGNSKNKTNKSSNTSLSLHKMKSDNDLTKACPCKNSVSGYMKKYEVENTGTNRSKHKNNKDGSSDNSVNKKRTGAGLHKSNSHLSPPGKFLRTMELIASWRNRHKSYKQERFIANDNCNQNQPNATAGACNAAPNPSSSTKSNNSAPFLEVTYFSSANIQKDIREKFDVSDSDDEHCDGEARIRGGNEECFLCGQYTSLSQLSFIALHHACNPEVSEVSEIST